MPKEIICSYCGAKVDSSLPKCPYCDSMIVEGAEQEYMDKLQQVRENLDDLKQEPAEAIKSEVMIQGKRIKKVILIVIFIIIIIVLLHVLNEMRYRRDNKADYIWKQQNYPVMSQMYEEGDFQSLEDVYWEALTDNKPIWDWEYYDEFNQWLEDKE